MDTWIGDLSFSDQIDENSGFPLCWHCLPLNSNHHRPSWLISAFPSVVAFLLQPRKSPNQHSHPMLQWVRIFCANYDKQVLSHHVRCFVFCCSRNRLLFRNGCLVLFGRVIACPEYQAAIQSQHPQGQFGTTWMRSPAHNVACWNHVRCNSEHLVREACQIIMLASGRRIPILNCD